MKITHNNHQNNKHTCGQLNALVQDATRLYAQSLDHPVDAAELSTDLLVAEPVAHSTVLRADRTAHSPHLACAHCAIR